MTPVSTLERNNHYGMNKPARQPWDDSAKTSLRVRQHFVTADPPAVLSRQASNIENRPRQSVHARNLVASVTQDDDMPFDLVNEAKREPEPGWRVSMESKSSIDRHTSTGSTEQETSFESVWESSPERVKPGVFKKQSPSQPHFTIRGPRFSDPSIMMVSRGGEQDDPTLHEINAQPSKSSVVEDEHPEHDLDDHDQKGGALSFEEANEVAVQFPDEGRRPVKVTHRVRRRTVNSLEVDDTSIESTKDKRRSPNSLQERTQHAWKSRQKKNSSLRSKRDPEVPRAANNVSFRAADTVQYFEPHVDEVTDENETGVSGDEKSLNSEYTKTLESEVEDMIKDIFFIGNGKNSQPGRRKYMYKHEVKKRLLDPDSEGSRMRIETSEGSDDDLAAVSKLREAKTVVAPETKKAIEPPARTVPPKQRTRSTTSGTKKPNKPNATAVPKKTLNDLSDAEAALWGFLDSGVAAVSSALGFTSEEKKVPAGTTSKSQRQDSADNMCSDSAFPFETCTGRITPDELQRKPALTDAFDNAQDMIYGQYGELIEAHANSGSKDSSKGSNGSLPLGNEIQNDSSSKETIEERINLPFSLDHIDEDPRVTQLALHAAKSLHRAQGVEFDDSGRISLHDDVQISVVELKLPLGLIFLENDGGCFVTKVAPDGSAARSGGVEVGDQLAAINGESCFRMKVDDICDMISNSPSKNCIELVFLRYIGPFRPSRNSRMALDGPSFDLDMTSDNILTLPGIETDSFVQPNRQPSKDQDKKKGFRIFGRGKNKAGPKK